MIRATIKGTYLKKNRRLQAASPPYVNINNNAELMENLKKNIDRREEKELSTSIQVRYCNFVNILKTEAQKVYLNNKVILSTETTELLNERKLLLQTKNKEKRKEIAEISKKINENIRKDRKRKRLKTFQYHIKKTGGVKKALKELESKKNWMPNMRNEQGKCTKKKIEILNTATEYYKNLYQSKLNKPIISSINDTQDSKPVPLILKEETERAIMTQKLGKAPGPDNITNELLRTSMSVTVPKLTNLFNEIIKRESMPEHWTKSTIVLLHKKGDKGDIGSYRPISLMSNKYKVFSKILLFRLSNTLEENQPKEQAGFRSNFSTIDHIHVLRQLLQKYREYNKVYYLGFVDFHKAFDSLEHQYMWESLKRQGVHTKYIRLLKIIYEKSTVRIKLERTGEEFSIERGVRQGDPTSPKLFSAVLAMIFRRLSWERFGLNVNYENLSHLRFADDLVLFSECPKALEKMLQQLSDESANAGLSVNGKKTKIMSNSQSEEPIRINNVQL
ncbi:LINE-1 retrotransposable element ORF2 protein [Eumeta japonica]|uniref:LINE-1 retrotransposable element ORF2 protein n=1 Tax=Eumeta variegata TaxID=151549 RepID=A0A4C1SMH8_EUMVA|nr:LINE-1 retrotransposable element ORF2 protein [Eumeta japonica]